MVIAPSGVFVIDTKAYGGRVSRSIEGPFVVQRFVCTWPAGTAAILCQRLGARTLCLRVQTRLGSISPAATSSQVALVPDVAALLNPGDCYRTFPASWSYRLSGTGKETTMAVDEQARFELHQLLTEVLGTSGAGSLMEYLPPVGWADVARKADLVHLATKAEMADVRTEIADLRTDLRTEIADLRSEVRTGTAGLRAELSDQLRAQTWRMMAVMFPALLGLAALVVTQPHV